MTRRRELIILAGILILAFILRMAFVHEPLERDEGLYAYIGQVILDGGLPYRDAIDHKPPGVHYLYALMIMAGGATPLAIRLLTGFYSLATVFIVYRTARLLAGVAGGLAAACCFAVAASGPLLCGSSSNTEVFLLLPLTAAFYLALRGKETGDWRFSAGSGVCAALAMLIKTVALPSILLFGLIACLPDGARGKWRAFLTGGVAFFAPLAIISGGVVLYFALNGALADFWHWNVVFNRSYGAVGLAGHLSGLRDVAPRLVEQLPLWLMAVPAAWFVMCRAEQRQAWPVVLFLGAAILGVIMPGRYFPHYFILLLPALAILAGIGFQMCRSLSAPLRQILLTVAGGAWLALAAYEYPWYLVYTPDEVVSRKYPNDRFALIARLAAELRQLTKPGETIYQWGFEPELYFLADRRSPTRYTIDQFAGASPDPARAAAELAAALTARPPRFILVIPQGNLDWPGYREVMIEVSRSYELVKEIDGAPLYRRRPGREG
jgi:4-amino-4-deoxy-L-arabinose transferase-like glycosyltransferase